ncbi:hypothetical protein NON00_11770, partial [Roseomonas sp. GC11]|nr:hypothetical protein [Roseomonas sp. GC11]
PLLAALATAAGLPHHPAGLRLTPLDRTALALGEDAPPGDYAPLRGLFRAEVADLAKSLGLPPPAAPDPAMEAALRALATEAALRALAMETALRALAGAPAGNAAVDAAPGGGYDPAEAARLWRRVAAASYKRRLAPPGPRLARLPAGPPLSDGMTSPLP